ncbi:P5-type ATPase cation transporter [Popillia japonica]|uniref:Cation-transporting ATPase n=1 Tax=Popillia japonica TaxID=7064 RepID=A0AAW1MJU1_POPJA
MSILKNCWSGLCFPKELSMEDREQVEQEAGLLRDVRQGRKYTMRLNDGMDDEMDVCGYRKSPLKVTVTYFVIIATAGLLRLVFHWMPHWFLKATSVQCDVNRAQYLLITENYNKKHKIYHVKPLKVLTADHVNKLKSNENLLRRNEVESKTYSTLSVHFGNGTFTDIDRLMLFTCKKVTYFWHPQKREFVKLMGLDEDVSSDVLHSNTKGLTQDVQFMRRVVYGPNEIVVPESSILTLLFLEVLNPFYVFQLFSFVLWFVDNYYYYAAAILAMSMFGITMTVIQTRRNQRNLKSTVQSSDVCKVLRPIRNSGEDGSGEIVCETELISTEHLVPGDILEIPTNGCMMQCDALLLTGNCILNESMLTGESVPVTKTPFPHLPDLYYNPKEHARHTLFCGTNVIQTRYFGGEKVIAVVVRTGFSTAKGGLVRSILFEKDSYRFVALLAFIALFGFIYTVVTKILRGVSPHDIVLEALDLITIVVPPALPAAMTVGRFYAQNRLQKKQIFCISPRSINVSGSIDCVCFDKTGTLTEDGLDLLCVVPVEGKKFQKPVHNVETLPYNAFVCGLVSCHSLTVINKQISGDPLDLKVCLRFYFGDPLDLKMFESTKWTIEENDISDNSKFNMIFPTVFKPPKIRTKSNPNLNETDFIDDSNFEIGTIREFPFSSSLQRMGVIIRKLGGQNFEYYCKGSPEMILNFVDPNTIPHNFHDVLECYTQEGYRVIALAHRELKMSYLKVQKVQREVIEKDLKFMGLIVLENRLKTDTTPCIKILNDACIRVIMVTGDNMLTALSVARDCGIVAQGQSVIAVNCDSDCNVMPKVYFTLTTAKRSNLVNNDLSLLSNSASIASLDTIESQIVTNNVQNDVISRPQNLYNNYRFALTGKVWSVVREHYPELVPKLVTRGAVFARMSPDQKQQLIQELQNLGYYVAMCGDGANDCGALKAAHTGISLSDAESSVASPFTSKNPNITCVLNVIREVLSFEHLKMEDWYVPFNASAGAHKDDVGCYENYAIFTISSFQYIILAIVFSKGKPYRKSIFTNYGLIIAAISVTAFSVFLAFSPIEFLSEQFELVTPKDVEFRLFLIGYAFANFIISLLVEIFFVDHLVFNKLRFKFHKIEKSKRKYLVIERDMDGDSKWPILTSNYRSAASPLTSTPQIPAEIVIETEKPDPNYLLKSLLQDSDTLSGNAASDYDISNKRV